MATFHDISGLRRLASALLLVLLAAGPASALTDADIASIAYEQPASRSADGAPAAIEPPSIGELAGKVALSMGLVLGLMAAAAWAARKWLPRQAQATAGRPGIDILATRVIGPRRSLLLVRAQGRTILIGVTPQSIQALGEFDGGGSDWAAPAAGPAEDVSFAAELARGTTLLERST